MTTPRGTSASPKPTALPDEVPATLRNTLRQRNFRIISIGQLVSNIGGWTQRVAQDWLILTLTGSATAVGVTTALQFLPTLLIGAWGGSLADRHPKRTILLTTCSIFAACAVALSVLTLTGAARPWHIYLIALVLGAAIAVDNPARQAFVSELVPPRNLRHAISINSASFQLGALIGPAVSGVLITLVGIGWSFVVNAATFSVTLTALAMIRSSDLHLRDRSGLAKVAMGAVLRTMHRDPHLWWPMVLAACFALYTVNLPVVLTAFAADVFASGASGLALMTSLLAAGSVIGSILAARRKSLRLRGLVVMSLLLVVVEAVAAVMPGQAAFGVMMVALGVAAVGFGVSANTTVQIASDDAIRGRVMALYVMATLGAGCIGGPIVGALGEYLGPRVALLVGAVFGLLATGIVVSRLAKATTPETWAEAKAGARDRVVAVSTPVQRVVAHPVQRLRKVGAGHSTRARSPATGFEPQPVASGSGWPGPVVDRGTIKGDMTPSTVGPV